VDGDATTLWDFAGAVNPVEGSTVIVLRLEYPTAITSVEILHETGDVVADVYIEGMALGDTTWTAADETAGTLVGAGPGQLHTWKVPATWTHDLATTPEAVFIADMQQGGRYATGTSSSATGTIFEVALPADVTEANGHRFTVCYCDPQRDHSLADTRSTFTYRLTDFTRSADTSDHIPDAEFGLLPEWSRHNCKRKCAPGCSGPDCFCEGWEEAEDTWLCLPPGLCRDACEAHTPANPAWSAANIAGAPAADCTAPGATCGQPLPHARCAALEAHATLNKCVLVRAETEADTTGATTCPDRQEAGAVSFLRLRFPVSHGGAVALGELAVKECNAALGGMTVVSATSSNGGALTPLQGDLMALDATANPGLSLFDDLQNPRTAEWTVSDDAAVAQDDEVVVVVKLPSPVRVTEVHVYHTGLTTLFVSGAATNDAAQFARSEVEFQVGGITDAQLNWHANKAEATVEDAMWARFDLELGASCTDPSDFDLAVGQLTVTRRARTHVDYIFEVDKPGSIEITNINSQDLAADTGLSADRVTVIDCSGACGVSPPTMHVSVPGTSMAAWNELYPMNTLVNEVPQDMTGWDDRDWGFSWGEILRFTAVRFSSAGTFKVCMCDSAATGGRCQSPADYAVEIGRAHVSGVSCLLQDPRFRTGVCCRQYWPEPTTNNRGAVDGTYRCYRDLRACPAVTYPPIPVATTTDPVVQPESPLATWCLFGPEEVTQLEPQCQVVAGYHGAV